MAAFIEANDVLAWVKDVSEVAFKLSDACEAVGGEFDSLSRDVYKLEKAFRTVKRDSKIVGSPFCLGIPQHRVEFEQVIQDCHCSFQVLDRILRGNAISQDVSPNSIDPLIQIGQELRNHTTQLKEVHRRTKIASVEVLYGQIGTLIGDIQSGKRDPHVLARIVNLDALSREMETIPPNALISPDETKSLEFPPRLQIPQSTIHEINTPIPSPGSRSPVVLAQLNKAQEAERSQNYHAPTVEDCEDADEEDAAYPSTSKSASQRPSDSSMASTSQSSTQPSVGSKGAPANSPSPPASPRNDGVFSPPKRADTDLLQTKKREGNIKEETEDFKERIKEMEQQKNLENFREFCRRWSAEDALDVQQEFRPLPDPTRRTFYVKPSGKIVEKGGVPLRDSKSNNPLHHEQRPAPPLRRSPTMESFNSFNDPRSPRGDYSDTDFNGHNTESPRTEAHRAFRYEPPVGSSAGYMHSYYGATSNGSSSYTPTAYGSPGYERWNNSTNSFDSLSLGSPGYFSSSSYNPTNPATSSYGSHGPFSHEPSSYNNTTSILNDYDRSAASSYDSYDGYSRPHHTSPFPNTTNATSTVPRNVPSSTDTSSTQPLFNVSPRSSTSLTPTPSPTGATTGNSPVPIPTTSAKGKEIFNEWTDSWQPTQNPRHRHRSHRNRNVEPESMDRNGYPPPLPPKEVDTEARTGRSGGTGSRRQPALGAFRR